ncbi:MAG: response regulator [Alphaproteobacteria bacterium]|nr:response regulator [Rhodospirillales bacterium]MCW9045158.1 response regulator [Alphaproteobacteria bacterium]
MNKLSNNVVVLPIKQRVLIVDDDPINRKIWNDVLSKMCRLEFASSGHEAIDKYPNFRPNLIVLDRMMPGMHGDDVLKKIRSLDKNGETKVIMHSMLEKTSDQIDGMSKGADLYIPKSTDIAVAVTQVQSLLEMQKSSHSGALFKVAREQLQKGSFSSNLVATGILRHASLLTDEIRAQRVDVARIAQDAISETRTDHSTPIVVDKEIGIQADTLILGNKDLLTQALGNVLTRALEVTTNKDTVTVKIEQRNDNVIVSIEDCGPPISPSERREIFHFNCDLEDPQVNLPVAWETAQRHHGDLVATDGEKGMVFSFTFPTAEKFIQAESISF